MKKMFFKLTDVKKCCFLIILVLFASCVANQKIAYRTDKIDALPSTIPITVCIKELSDVRRNMPDNSLLFEKKRNTYKDSKNVCINSEKHYKNESVTLQISRQIAGHFDKIKLFQQTTFADDSQTDYYLTGSLSYFYGEQGFSTAALVGSHFGLIGALATSGAKTVGHIVIEIQDIALYDKNGNLIQEFGTYSKEYLEELPADAYCWYIYGNMNRKLQDFTEGLANKFLSEYSNKLAD